MGGSHALCIAHYHCSWRARTQRSCKEPASRSVRARLWRAVAGGNLFWLRLFGGGPERPAAMGRRSPLRGILYRAPLGADRGPLLLPAELGEGRSVEGERLAD